MSRRFDQKSPPRDKTDNKDVEMITVDDDQAN